MTSGASSLAGAIEQSGLGSPEELAGDDTHRFGCRHAKGKQHGVSILAVSVAHDAGVHDASVGLPQCGYIS